MGCCSSVPGDGKGGDLTEPFAVTIAFPNRAPLTLTIAPNEPVSAIRERARAAIQAPRAADGNAPVVVVDGPIMTVRANSGEAVALDDNMSVQNARIEPRQYLWFQDKREDARVRSIVLRGSRLTEDVAANSRGVKQGMMALQMDDGK